MQLEYARQTHGLVAAALVGALIPAAVPVYSERLIADYTVAQVARRYAGSPSSNSTLQIVTTTVDELLAQEFSKVFLNLAQQQRELDGAARRALYGNLKRLYLR